MAQRNPPTNAVDDQLKSVTIQSVPMQSEAFSGYLDSLLISATQTDDPELELGLVDTVAPGDINRIDETPGVAETPDLVSELVPKIAAQSLDELRLYQLKKIIETNRIAGVDRPVVANAGVDVQLVDTKVADTNEAANKADKEKKTSLNFIQAAIASDSFKNSVDDIWRVDNKPYWAQSRFDCLIFKIGTIELAAPLMVLGSILPVEEPFTGLPGQPDWFLGLMKSSVSSINGQRHNVQVIDTARWLMGERYDAKFKESIGFVITLVDQHWGLACSDVHNAITLESDHIKWRSSHRARPWIAGTVIDRMCSILDVESLGLILAHSDFQQ